jgi:hypothetical protein
VNHPGCSGEILGSDQFPTTWRARQEEDKDFFKIPKNIQDFGLVNRLFYFILLLWRRDWNRDGHDDEGPKFSFFSIFYIST